MAALFFWRQIIVMLYAIGPAENQVTAKVKLKTLEVGMICIFDTRLKTSNLGDHIIMDSVDSVVSELWPKGKLNRIATHEFMSLAAKFSANFSNIKIVGGTNLLNANIRKYKQWKLRNIDAYIARNSILLGCGWWQYDGKIGDRTRQYWRSILCATGLHSVRDDYTKRRLLEMGVENVVVTGCPTLWRLSRDHCKGIPVGKASSCVVTLTDYNKSVDHDKMMIDICRRNYERVFFWPQGSGDVDYVRSLSVDGLNILPWNLNAFNSLLCNSNVDYIGTRLHGGIRAMQFARRAIILEIDNRAREMGATCNLPTVARDDAQSLEDMIVSEWETHVELPHAAIDRWKSQFQPAST